ncbi:MAG: aminotransferase class V-fold PLP-dependent enzyme [Anaerolineae bacterium]|nr:aminotransferase class V-fold PLP-dependent enzyme [Anaerolineae bacterium]
MSNDLLHWRDEFPILQRKTYMVSNSLGAMPRAVYDSLHRYADMWAEYGVQSWSEEWFALNGVIGDKIGNIINAPAATVSIHQNASLATSILISALNFPPERNKIVMDAMTFPTIYYALKALLPPHIEIELVPTHDHITIDTDELLAAIDERTALVPISHVLFRSAYIMPVQAVIEKAHQVGAQVLLDGYHSVGIIPVDVQALSVDYYIGGVLKWMCGGPGGVFLYTRPDLLPTLQPRITGWFAHKRPFAFEVDSIDLREDAYRLLNGTFGVPSLYAIQPGIEIIGEVGVDHIRANSIRQTALLIELAQNAGYELHTPLNPAERGGTVTINPPHAYEVSRELLARDILVDYREQAGIRVSPHFYNTDDEIRQTVDAIGDILADGSWQKHTNNRSFVT